MSLSVADAAEVFRQALRDAVRRHALWYLVQGVILLIAGVLAVLYPAISSVAVINLLGWLLIVPFWVVSAFNGFDGAMSGMGLAQGPTIPPLVGSLLLLPAVALHFVLMLRRGAPKSKTTA